VRPEEIVSRTVVHRRGIGSQLPSPLDLPVAAAPAKILLV
jgi:hypothetical protein